jgi:type III secretion system FlhB-like substrate exporter
MPAKEDEEDKTRRTVTLSALQLKQSIPKDKYQRIAEVHNFNIGQWG